MITFLMVCACIIVGAIALSIVVPALASVLSALIVALWVLATGIRRRASNGAKRWRNWRRAQSGDFDAMER